MLLKDILPNYYSALNARVHGNGFAQYELADGSKLHVWSPGCPRQKVYSGIHNHLTGFTSTVLMGRLLNIEYVFSSTGVLHHAYKAVSRQDKDTILVQEPNVFCVSESRRMEFSEGSRYTFPDDPRLFHSSHPLSETVVTRVEGKRKSSCAGARVLCEAGKSPDNEFSRYDPSFEPFLNKLWRSLLMWSWKVEI